MGVVSTLITPIKQNANEERRNEKLLYIVITGVCLFRLSNMARLMPFGLVCTGGGFARYM